MVSRTLHGGCRAILLTQPDSQIRRVSLAQIQEDKGWRVSKEGEESGGFAGMNLRKSYLRLRAMAVKNKQVRETVLDTHPECECVREKLN